ncbi:MAG: hypothetical protein KAU35_05375 [candidate division Zixibacteria bacterium]|nr:hypothetical protein [candidate division Zixibacteria bacterium]
MEKSRTAEQVFLDMHRELRAWNPQVPESPERLDPILRILLELYSHQLARIDTRMDRTWEIARQSLIRSLSPESKRWPVPAFTVMRCRPTDPAVEVDPHTRFYYKEKREGGQTFFFSPERNEKLLSAEVKHVFLKLGDSIIDLSPVAEDRKNSSRRTGMIPPSGDNDQVFVAIDYNAPPMGFDGAMLFMTGAQAALRQLRWAYWYPGNQFGAFYEDSGFCPGLAGDLDDIFATADQPRDWGCLRSTADILKPLENSLVVIPEQFASTWEPGPVSEDLVGLMSRSHIDPAATRDKRYWLRADLPPDGDRSAFLSSVGLYFDALVAFNKNELTLFKHTGGNRLVEIELPENISTILEVGSVVDSNGQDYLPVHRILESKSRKCYSLEERDDRLVLWFDFSGTIDKPPDSITVSYSVTSGVSANGIAIGRITELYESHPGIEAVENIVPTMGAIPARTLEQVVTEASARLRNRDRALSFKEIANWARAFDPRITHAECENSVERARRGVRRCVLVRATVDRSKFLAEDETSLLKIRLKNFLSSRSPVNTRFRIEIAAK